MIQLKKTLLTLVALFAMTTGAWADEGTLLVTINSSENTDFKSGSKTFDNIVTVTFSGTVNNGGDDDGWEIHNVEATPVTLTVTAAEGSGYTITSVKFTTYDDHSPLTDTEFPFVATLYGESYYPKTTISDQANGIWGGVNKIEVYGTPAPAGTALTPDATRKVWTLDAMPAGNVELQVAYFPGMLTLPAKTAQGSIEVVADPFTQLVPPAAWATDYSGILPTDVPGIVNITLDEAKAWAGLPKTGAVTLLYGYEDKGAYVDFYWASFTDGEFVISGSSSYGRNNIYYDINHGTQYFYAIAALPDGFEQDEQGNIYVEPKTQFQVKAVPAEGYHLVSLSDGTNTYDVDADGIATVTMPEGDADLTLTATFSDEFELTFDDVNFKTNQNITVKVGDADKTLDQDGKLSVKAGQTVTLTAKQGYKFRSVEAKKAAKPAAKTTDLSTLTADYEAQDGETLKGTLGGNYKITIADKATVTLDGVTINSTNSAGITCEGGATIILSGTNAVTGAQNYPGIQAGSTGTTLTIQGDGSLTATGGSSGAGIGGGYQIACGNITISGGTVTATGKANGAGIGSGQNASCGNIIISGGTVTATGGFAGAGIGSGYGSGAMCGDITITSGVTSVTATKGSGSGGNAANSIGKGGGTSSCGTVTIEDGANVTQN